MQDATLAAVALLRLGHQALAILEGGVLRWAAERRPLVAHVRATGPGYGAAGHCPGWVL